MKFDYIVGNPPYQDETNGDKRNYAPPIYNYFIDEAYKIGDTVELIHPARFLFNAGSTSKEWNRKMLDDSHLKVLYYEPDSNNVFPSLSTPIKGGVAITYRNKNVEYGAIGTFSQHLEMNSVVQKVKNHKTYISLGKIVYPRTSYRLTDKLHKDYPYAITKLSDGHAYDMSSNIISLLPEIFRNDDPNDGNEYVRIIGRDGERVTKYIKREYINSVENLYKYKVFIAQANGSGLFGETISPPIIAEPGTGHTETFLSIGNFDTYEEAEFLNKYIKTKFLRSLRSVLKVTQNGNKPVWRLIPLQDFTSASDIDWSQSIADIDLQLYAKYGLDDSEIEFIESHVKEMT